MGGLHDRTVIIELDLRCVLQELAEVLVTELAVVDGVENESVYRDVDDRSTAQAEVLAVL